MKVFTSCYQFYVPLRLAISVILKIGWELWYQYIVRIHAGGDNMHRKQLFSRVKSTDTLHRRFVENLYTETKKLLK